MADSIWTAVDTRTGSVSGDQDITNAAVQETPLAGLFICNKDGDPSDGAERTIGFTDGTNQFALAWTSETGGATTQTAKELNATTVVHVKPRSSTPRRSAAFSAFLSDGVRLDWDPVGEDSDSTSTYKVTSVLFGGASMSVHADTFTSNATEDASVDVTAPGFQADLVLFLSIDDVLSTSRTALECVFGIYVRSDLKNICHVHSEADGGTEGIPKAFLRTNRAGQATNSGGTKLGSIDVSANANGFTATTRGSNDGVLWAYLAISFGGAARVHAEVYDTPAATGDDDVTASGFNSQFVLGYQTRSSVVDPASATLDEFSGIGVFDGTTTAAHGISIEDGAPTTNTQSHYSSSTFINQTDGLGAESNKATISFLPVGYRLNYSAADTGTVRKYLMLAIESIPIVGLFFRQPRDLVPRLKQLDAVEQAIYFHGRERRRSLAGVPELFRDILLPIPTTPFVINRYPDVDQPATLRTAIRVTGATPQGLIFEIGNATTALAIWVDDNIIGARMGDTGDDAAVATFDNTISLPVSLELDIVVAVRPGDGRIRMWFNGTERARATAVNGQLPNGVSAQSNGAFASAAIGPLPADVTQTGSPSNFDVIEPLAMFRGQTPRHFV